VGSVVESCNTNGVGQPYVLTLQRCSVAGETCTTNAAPGFVHFTTHIYIKFQCLKVVGDEK
jgi:hypothetical protein